MPVSNKRNQTLEKWLIPRQREGKYKMSLKILSHKARFSKNDEDVSKGNRSQFEGTSTYPSGTI